MHFFRFFPSVSGFLSGTDWHPWVKISVVSNCNKKKIVFCVVSLKFYDFCQFLPHNGHFFSDKILSWTLQNCPVRWQNRVILTINTYFFIVKCFKSSNKTYFPQNQMYSLLVRLLKINILRDKSRSPKMAFLKKIYDHPLIKCDRKGLQMCSIPLLLFGSICQL